MTGSRPTVVAVVPDAGTELVDRIATRADGLAVRTVTTPERIPATVEDADAGGVLVDGRRSTDASALVEAVRAAVPSLPVVALLADGDAGSALDAGAAAVVRADDEPTAEDVTVATNRLASVVTGLGPTFEADHRLDALLQNSTERISVLDEDGRYTFVSPAVERLLGYEPESLRGESSFEYVHPDDRERVRAAFERVSASPGESETIEYRIAGADGEWHWVASRGTNHLETPGIEGIVLNTRVITDRKRHQRRLSEERAFTESVFAALPDVFYAFDEAGNFLRWNDLLSTVTGYDDEEIEGMHPTELVVPEDRTAVAEAMAEVLETGATVTVEAAFLTKDGERIPYEFTGGEVADRTGETIGLVGIGRDISERKERERRFEAVFNNSYQLIGLLDTDGTLLEANETARRFGGVDRDEVVGRKLWETPWFQNDEARQAAREAVEAGREGTVYRTELTVQASEGTETIDFSVRPVTDDRGRVTLLIPEGRPITDLKRREQHLEVLHRFLRHNLRNKMTVIEGTADALRRRLEDPTLGEHAAHIVAAARELNDLSETAHQLSQVAIEEDLEREPVDLAGALARAVAAVGEDYPAATIQTAADGDEVVRADWRLETVFEQLVENAVEHADREAPTVEISVERTGSSVVVRVADDGPGIPEEELTGITTDEEPTQLTHGTGFGLWLVRSVVDDYGGRIDYEPRPAGGSVVIVELPAADTDPSARDSDD